jgi:hypothetical protein
MFTSANIAVRKIAEHLALSHEIQEQEAIAFSSRIVSAVEAFFQPLQNFGLRTQTGVALGL